jgi:hypothetical protein
MELPVEDAELADIAFLELDDVLPAIPSPVRFPSVESPSVLPGDTVSTNLLEVADPATSVDTPESDLQIPGAWPSVFEETRSWLSVIPSAVM